MKVVVNRGSGYFHPDLIEKLMDELVNRGWKVTTWDDNYNPLDDTAYIFLNKTGILLSNSKHKDGLSAFIDKIRTDPDFIEIIENKLVPQLIEEYPELEIIDIPDNVKWYIQENIEGGGYEKIHEAHRIW